MAMDSALIVWSQVSGLSHC